jgi:motility quorum-sensing regulator/GCU-specific mRNA interferase toxin
MHVLKRPTYNLSLIQQLVQDGAYVVTGTALAGAAALSFDSEDIRACVLALTLRDLYKTMESTDRPGLWQDVYKPLYGGVRVYVKLQLSAACKAVVIQFKQK